MRLSHEAFDRAEHFMNTQSRELERVLFVYHFRPHETAQADVLDALSRFQNADGGFGHALEPDVRMPQSSVVATKYALQILLDVRASKTEPLVRKAIAYLLEQFDAPKGVWPLVDELVMFAPHASWWDFDGLEGEFGSFQVNPKAGILRCLLEYPSVVPEGVADSVLESLMTRVESLPEDMALFDAISLMQLLQAGTLDSEVGERLLERLSRSADQIVSRNPEEWNSFAVMPMWLAPSPNAPLAELLAGPIEHQLDFEIDNQNDDGSWSPRWSWGDTDSENWAVADMEWKGILTLAMLRSLRDFGRIEGLSTAGPDSEYKYHID